MKQVFIFLMVGFLAFLPVISQAEVVHYMEMAEQGGPFQIVDKEGKRSGIITDIVFEIFKNSPYKLKVHTWPYLRMRQNMRSGKISRLATLWF